MKAKYYAGCYARVTSHETNTRRNNGSPETKLLDGIRESEGGITTG